MLDHGGSWMHATDIRAYYVRVLHTFRMAVYSSSHLGYFVKGRRPPRFLRDLPPSCRTVETLVRQLHFFGDMPRG